MWSNYSKSGKIIDLIYKRRESRRVFLLDIYNYAKNKSIEKLSKKTLETIFNYNNNSKNEISSVKV